MAKEYFNLMELEQISAAIQAAKSLGVLRELEKHPHTAAELALKKGGNAAAYKSLLDTLQAVGYLQESGGSYASTEDFRKLVKDGSFNWSHLPKFLESGKPWIQIDESMETLDSFYQSFFQDVGYAAQMKNVADSVASKLAGSKVADLLDVGTGTGLWSLAMAQQNSDIQVTGVDLPGVLKVHFLKRAKDLKLDERVSSIEGDFHDVDFGREKFDRVVLGSSFHFIRVEEAARVVGRLVAAVKPGGELVIIDHFADGTTNQRLSRVLYEMRLAMRTLHAKNYSKAEILHLMTQEPSMFLKDAFEVEGPGFLSVLHFKKLG